MRRKEWPREVEPRPLTDKQRRRQEKARKAQEAFEARAAAQRAQEAAPPSADQLAALQQQWRGR